MKIVKGITGVALLLAFLCSCKKTQQPTPFMSPKAVVPSKYSKLPKAKPIAAKQVIESVPRLRKQPYAVELPFRDRPGTISDSNSKFQPVSPKTVSSEILSQPQRDEIEPFEREEIEQPPIVTIKPTVPPIQQPNQIEPLPKVDKVDPLTDSEEETSVAQGVVKQIIVTTNNATRIIEANGLSVVVEGDDGLILITGGTDQLIVKGDSNQIQCDSVTDIKVSGNKNNLVVEKFGGGEVSGNFNQIGWEKGVIGGFNPIVTDSGSDNEIGKN